MFSYVTWVAVIRSVSIFQVEMLSWGYLFHRAYTLQINLFPLVSRVPNARVDNQHTENEITASNLTEEIKLTGRIMLNIWRLMRHEVHFTRMHTVTLPVLNCITHWNLVTCSQTRHLPFSVRGINRLRVWNVKDGPVYWHWMGKCKDKNHFQVLCYIWFIVGGNHVPFLTWSCRQYIVT